MSGLKGLGLVSCGISDINPINKLKQLRTLELYDNRISDIKVLSGLKKLKKLYLSKNRISCIGALVRNVRSGGFKNGCEINLLKNPLSHEAKKDAEFLRGLNIISVIL